MKHVVVGTAGHIDHGKSALVEALTGINPDRLQEEKVRGITIDLGFAHRQVGDLMLAFVDVPGHERFVRHMLAGASGIDLVLLVIAADESVKPQTREHFDICRLLHVPAGVIALTKTDLTDRETTDLVRLEVEDLVAQSFLSSAPIVPVSARTGDGLDALERALVNGAGHLVARRRDGATRLPIDRVFSMRGFGTVVTGTLASGEIAADDQLVIHPRGRAVKVRGLQVHGAKVERAAAGQRVAVNLAGVDVADIARGDAVVAEGAFEATRVVDASLDLLSGARPLAHGTRVRFHQGTAELLGRVSIAVTDTAARGRAQQVSRPSGQKKIDAGRAEPEAVLEPGGRAIVRIRLEQEGVFVRGDRFIVRAYSPPVTIGGGLVLDPRPPRGGVRTTRARARFERLLEESREGSAARESQMIDAMVGEAGRAGLLLSAVRVRLGWPPDRIEAEIDKLRVANRVVVAGVRIVAPAVVEELRVGLLAALEAFHAQHPLEAGLPREEVKARVWRGGDAEIFDALVARLTTEGVILGRDRLSLALHRPQLSVDETRAQAAVVEAFRAGGLAPPDVAGLSKTLDPKVVAAVIALLVRQGVLVRLDGLIFDREALTRLRADLDGLKRAAGNRDTTIHVAAFKQRYGVSRKFAIPLLEYLDRERVTRRVGDVRILL